MAYWPILLGGLLSGVGQGLEERRERKRRGAEIALQLGGPEALSPDLFKELGYGLDSDTISRIRDRLAGQERFRRWSALPQEARNISMRDPGVQEMLRRETGYETPYSTESIEIPGLQTLGGPLFEPMRTEAQRYEYQAPIYPMTAREGLEEQSKSALSRAMLTAASQAPNETSLMLEALGREGMLSRLRKKAQREEIPKTPFQYLQQFGTPEQVGQSAAVGGGLAPGPNVVYQGGVTQSEGEKNRQAAMARVTVGMKEAMRRVLVGQTATDIRQKRGFVFRADMAAQQLKEALRKESRALLTSRQRDMFNKEASALLKQYEKQVELGGKPSIARLERQLLGALERLTGERASSVPKMTEEQENEYLYGVPR